MCGNGEDTAEREGNQTFFHAFFSEYDVWRLWLIRFSICCNKEA
jgi:hypothetical protein